MERDKLAVLQSLSDHECQNLRLRRLSALSGRYEREPERTLEGKIKLYFVRVHLKDLNSIDGEPMEFDWKMLPGFTTFGLLEKIQKLWKIDSVNQSSSMARSSSCQCSTTLYGVKKEMRRNVKIILVQLRIMLADFLAVILGTWMRKEMVRNLL